MAKQKLNLNSALHGVDDFNPKAAAQKLTSGSAESALTDRHFKQIPIDKIIEFRAKEGKDFHSYVGTPMFDALVESIREEGLMQPVVVRALDDGSYEMLAGEHRWQAVRSLGMTHIIARVCVNLTDDQAMQIFTASNLISREMTERDRAIGWAKYTAASKKIRGLDKEEKYEILSAATGLSPEAAEEVHRRTRHRYAKIGSDLIPELLDRMDLKSPMRLPMTAAYCLAFLDEKTQRTVSELNCCISQDSANLLKKCWEENPKMTVDEIRAVLIPQKPEAAIPTKPEFKKAKKTNKFLMERLSPAYYDAEKFDKLALAAFKEYLDRHPEFTV